MNFASSISRWLSPPASWGGQRDLDPVVDVEPLRVVVCLLRGERDPAHEAERLVEIGEGEGFPDRVASLDLLPAVERGERRRPFRKVQSLYHAALLSRTRRVHRLGGGGKPRYHRAMTAPATRAPTLDEIAAIARDALESLPETFRRLAGDVVIRVAEFPDAETERDMELQSPFELMGLYSGVPIGERGAVGSRQEIDMIFLYRRPMLDYWCETGEDLVHVVRHVLVHEIGHHFGLSDEDMERIEEEAGS